MTHWYRGLRFEILPHPDHYCPGTDTSNPAVIESLLKAGADIKARDKFFGLTPLMWAAEDNSPEVIELLLKANDVDVIALEEKTYQPGHSLDGIKLPFDAEGNLAN